MTNTARKNASQASVAPDQVYLRIIDAIVDQRLLPGARLNELEMCEVFGIPRRAMERIFQRLAFEGVVSIIANRGAFVASPEASEAQAIFSARKVIESGIMELVAVRASGADFKALENNIAQEEEHRRAGRMREAIKLSGQFHLLLSEIAGNPILIDQVRQLVARTSLVTSLFKNLGGMGCWHDDHGKLIAHLRAQRVGPAIADMRHHLNDLEESLDLDLKAGAKNTLHTIFKDGGA